MKIKFDEFRPQHFNHLDFSRTKRGAEGNFPDFLVVGPQRTGTTWIYTNLRNHPAIQFSYPKELYYFNRLLEKKGSGSLHLENFSLKQYLSNPKALIRELAKIAYFDLARTGFKDTSDIQWYTSFFERDSLAKLIRSIQKLPEKQSGEILYGECTASYAALPESMIEDIVKVNPNIRIVLMMRDPVERAWSHAKKDLVRDAGRSLEDVEEQQFLDFFRSDYQLSCADYSSLISRWQSQLSNDALFVGDYRRITSEPVHIALDIFSHIGVDRNSDFLSPSIATVVNPTAKDSTPPPILGVLETILGAERRWVERALS